VDRPLLTSLRAPPLTPHHILGAPRPFSTRNLRAVFPARSRHSRTQHICWAISGSIIHGMRTLSPVPRMPLLLIWASLHPWLTRRVCGKIVCSECNQLTASHGITLQDTATRCNSLQLAATHCNILQLTATLQQTATHCITLQHVATYCNTLQQVERSQALQCEEHMLIGDITHTDTHCNTLQHTATHCNTLQHTATLCNKCEIRAHRRLVTGSGEGVSGPHHSDCHALRSLLQHTATHCITLHHTAPHCTTLQHV